MSAAHTDNIKTIAKKNTVTDAVIYDILNHSQENFIIEMKPMSWSSPDPIFFSKMCIQI